MADVQFRDFSIQVKEAMNEKCIAYLHEAAGELEAQAKRNMPPGQWFAQQKGQWTYKVDESKLEATVGNPMEQALWTEFGTGEHAINGDGRKGYWVYVKGSGGSVTSTGGKQYSLQEAKRIVAMMRADGLDAHYTKGQTAKRPLFNAFTSLKAALIRRAETVLKGL